MEDVALHRSGGNDVYKVVPRDKEISNINKKITIHHVYLNRENSLDVMNCNFFILFCLFPYPLVPPCKRHFRRSHVLQHPP